MRTILIITLVLAVSACRDIGSDVPPVLPPGPGTPPVITGVFPDSAAVGDTILVAGSGFGDIAGSSVLTIGGAAATAIVAWTASRIIAGVPAGASGGAVIVTIGGLASSPAAFRIQPVAEARISYAGQVVPLLTSKGCTGCHGGTNNLFVTPYASLMAGTSSHGPVVTPYHGEGSVIVRKLRGTAGFGNRMPQGGPFLSEAEIETIARWIKQGAKNN
jgi:mono/diheme cytochrome c family protein